MPKAEWGTKRICLTTGKRFYDLNKNPIISPYTGEVVDIESQRRKTSAVTSPARATPAKAKKVPDSDLDTDDDDDLLSVVESDDSDDDVDLLEDDGDDTVSLDDLADVSSPDDDN